MSHQNQNKIDDLIYRISRGSFNFNFNKVIYIVRQPSLELRYLAHQLYNDIIHKNRFQSWVKPEQFRAKLIQSGILSNTYNNDLDTLHKSLDNLKLSLYTNFLNTNKQKKIRQFIKKAKNNLVKLSEKIHSLDHLTLHGHALVYKQEFILINTLYINDELAFPDYDNASYTLLNNIFSHLLSSYITTDQYRDVANNIIWREYWKAAKSNPFPLSKLLTEEQQRVINFSSMYDSVYESNDKPHNDVIDDHDMLDGWFLQQKKEMEDMQKQNKSDKLSNQHNKAQEIFVVANSKEDINNINDMNTMQAKMVKKQRTNLIKKKGEVIEQQLPDRKLEIMRQSHEDFKQRVKSTKSK